MSFYDFTDKFVNRHIGPDENETKEMLSIIGADSVEELINQTIPEKIRLKEELNISKSMSESEFLNYLRGVSKKNKIAKSYIGMGYNPSIMPPVIQRNILENPGWYTQYTPYQAEISQGRLEILLNFQTVISDMTSLPIANASLLDEATSAAEAMMMFFATSRSYKKNANKFFVDINVFPQTTDVLKTRANPNGIEIVVGDHTKFDFDESYFGVLVQNPNSNGELHDYSDFFAKCRYHKILTVAACDLLSLAIVKSPGEMGVDAAVGSSQRFGLPMGFGGPHAGYFATRDDFKRIIPGRIIGVSIDSQGNRALRMALQTREQHIRREKATSNICTSQVLLAILSAVYAIYHGADGIKAIASRINALSSLLEEKITKLGYKQLSKNYFDTLKIKVSIDEFVRIKEAAEIKLINFRYFNNDSIGISFGEDITPEDIEEIGEIFKSAKGINVDIKGYTQPKVTITKELERESLYLQHEVFRKYHSETELIRYLKRLENKDLSLTLSMIPLGSCTMKLNAAAEMLLLTLPELAQIHPFAPESQVEGYKEIIKKLEIYLNEITGFAATSFEPNSGAQGEYTGLMVIRQYHIDRGDKHRNVTLIPSSAHGTNPASAVMSGMKVIVVACDDKGNIDINDLKKKAEENKDNLSALMVTYPSTHGVFEEEIIEICKIVHDAGGQVYMDGANMNAQVGFTSPARIGADVCHLNLHKTFAIPHGGGGPGMGPICVAGHLKKYLPTHTVVKVGGEKGISAVSASPYGSASILIISLAYIMMLGAEGLKKATAFAILNANYIMKRLQPYYKTLYTGEHGRVAHEMIFDMREFKHSINLEVEDIAKRLMDYGFHAPTVSFPVAGTLMVEPTESEAKFELDRFCDAMISIRNEIKEIEEGVFDVNNNVLKNAPHTAEMVIADDWKFPYSREKAAFPNEYVRKNKFWTSIARINNAYGDRNLICSCSFEI
ncbi:MAG: aminomethyl-transferring glycine dehydrogenase [Ignavibacteriaceae bacterium]